MEHSQDLRSSSTASNRAGSSRAGRNQADKRRSDRDSTATEVTSVHFAKIAREIAGVARSEGLVVPTFRSPPRSTGLRRSIRWRADGSATVSVALRGRPAVAVVADMIDGLAAANRPQPAPPGANSGFQLSKVAYDRLWRAALPMLGTPSHKPQAVTGAVLHDSAVASRGQTESGVSSQSKLAA